MRQTYSAPAARGSAEAIAKLTAPPFPEVLRYLWDWFRTLHTMRGAGLAGPARLTALDIYAANQLYDWGIEPHEVEALNVLDAVTLYPDPPKKKEAK
jgi:hypothetical protein